MTKDNNRTVWSSGQGLPLSGVRKEESKTRKIISVPAHQQTIYLHRDSKGRGGKSVTLVKNLILSEEDMRELAKRLKQVCGSGGTVKDSIIEIQGEHREKVAEELKKIGYKVKIAGG
jgi:translation initiation factor 1